MFIPSRFLKRVAAGSSAVALLLVASGCSRAPAFTEAPTVIANPNPAVPLAAVVRFAADRPVTTTIHVTDGKHAWDLNYNASHDPRKGLAVIGMRPDRKHEIRVSIRDADGNAAQAPRVLEFKTPPLPSDPDEFPPIRITVEKTDRMEPGFTLFNPRRRKVGDQGFGASFGMLLAVDADGVPVWYYRTNSRISDLERLQNGHVLFVTQDYRAVEIDMLGNVVAQWYASGRPQGPVQGAIPIDTLAFHHDIDELPNGHFVVLGVEKHEIDNYYTSEYDPKAPRKRQDVMGDEIIEFTREGKEVWRWKAFDHLDPFRIGYETFSPYWARRGFPETVDWTHANSLVYDPRDDSLLVNMRVQSAIVKIARPSGEIRWILGPPVGWPAKLKPLLLKPLGSPFRWFYQEHAVNWTPKGTLVIFDNGDYEAFPFTPPVPPAKTYSRAVEYAIDEKAMTVKQLWQSEGPGPDAVLSFAMGDVDWMPETGNILVHYGALIPPPHIGRFNWRNALQLDFWTRIREYTHTSPPEVVWELVLGDPSGKSRTGWTLFGGDRVKNLGAASGVSP